MGILCGQTEYKMRTMVSGTNVVRAQMIILSVLHLMA